MNPAKLIAALEPPIENLVRSRYKGRVAVARDALHALQLLLWSVPGLLVVLHFGGDDSTDEAGVDHVAAHTIEVTVGQALGLQANQELSVYQELPGNPALLTAMSEIRAYVLAMQFPEEETNVTPEYGNCVAVTLPGGLPLAAYRFSVRLNALLDVDDDAHAVRV